MIKENLKYLVTFDEWFVAPDGDTYSASWGKCKVLNIEDVFGFKPLKPSTNWYLQIGENDKEVIVAGCQIHYAVRCPEKPKDKYYGVTYTHPEDYSIHNVTKIYIAE
jgi:hypothetical protein